MDDDPSGLALSRHQCLALLDACRVGRVVFTEHALPAALPVNFSLLDDDIVFRTATGGKLAVALSRAVVAFQADDIDPVSETGWTVLVQGWATLITRPDELARARDLELQSWAPGDRWHFVRIRSEILSGHRFVRRPTGSAVTARASTPAPAGDGPAVAPAAGAAG